MKSLRHRTFAATAATRCIFYAVTPWWLYEEKCHYGKSQIISWAYLRHMKNNFTQATVWMLGKHTAGDIRFEIEVNNA